MNASEIGEIIINIRSEYRLTSQEFGKMYNVTYQMVCRWEKGDSLPSKEIIKKICEDFEIDLNSSETKKKGSRRKLLAILLIMIAITIIFIIFCNVR